jgi:hypothetical protein
MEMELSPLEEHLQRLRIECAAYLATENNPLVNDIPQPEPLKMFYLMQNFDLPPAAGGFLDQPYVMIREQQVCMDSVAHHRLNQIEPKPNNQTSDPLIDLLT